ncbi:MAG: SPFH domain-containing protein [Planctomycetes bacterium]|nr:SPFH domain-containing protein [Planctomycetota bacterium]
MGLMDKLRGEFIDIIQWTEPSQNEILAYRFPRYNNEIKMGAKLVVREGQNAVFVNEGKLADVFAPGTYTLSTQNMPILATLQGWKYGFESPFKAEVYFISMRQWTDQKWGTANPIMIRDPEFGPVRIRAFGTYAMHVSEPAVFLKELVATDPSFETFEISNQLRNTIVSRFADVMGQIKMPILDLAGNYEKLNQLALQTIKPDLAQLGLALTMFYVENISLPEEVEKALDTRSKMSVIGDLNRYTHYQAATAIGDAANNPGGAAGAGVGLGAGIAVGGQMANVLAGSMGAGTAPPPLPTAAGFYVAVNGQQAGPFDLPTLGTMLQNGQLKRDSLVWRRGLTEWVAASTVPDLASLFAAAPPPLPPQ